jgi:hypothetical protein
MSTRRAERKASPLPELARLLVRLNHACFIINADRSGIWTGRETFYSFTTTGVPSGLASKKCSAIPLGKRMQPCDAAYRGT